MTTQNIILGSSNTLATKSNSIKSNASQRTEKFGNLFDNNLSGASKTLKPKSDEAKQNKNITTNKSEKKVSAFKETNPVKKASINTSADSKKISESSETADMTDKVETVKTVLKKLQDEIQSILDLSDEELKNALENLGYTMADLLNPINMQQLVLQISGQDDIASVLMDEKLSNTMNQLLQVISDLKSGQELVLTEDLLKQIKEENGSVLMSEESQNISDPNYLTNGSGVNMTTETTESKGLFEQDVSGIKVIVENISNQAKTEGLQDGQELSMVNQEANQNTIVNGSNPETSNNSSNESFLQSEQLKSAEGKDNDKPTGIEENNDTLFLNNLFGIKPLDELNLQNSSVSVRAFQEITNQIVEQIKVLINPEQTSMELQLNPESLGKINLSVVSKNGIMTAQFTTQNEITKEALESQMQVLKDNLMTQGLKVESIEVTVSQFAFEQSSKEASTNQEQQSKSRSRNFITFEEDIDSVSSEDVSIRNASIGDLGSSVDFNA